MSTQSLESIRAILTDQLSPLKKRFGVRDIGIFGSVVSNQHKAESDIDILVRYETGKKTYDNYIDLKHQLELLFGMSVDLVIEDTIREELRISITSAAVYV